MFSSLCKSICLPYLLTGGTDAHSVDMMGRRNPRHNILQKLTTQTTGVSAADPRDPWPTGCWDSLHCLASPGTSEWHIVAQEEIEIQIVISPGRVSLLHHCKVHKAEKPSVKPSVLSYVLPDFPILGVTQRGYVNSKKLQRSLVASSQASLI